LAHDLEHAAGILDVVFFIAQSESQRQQFGRIAGRKGGEDVAGLFLARGRLGAQVGI